MILTTVKIDGMACGMCETHINETLRRALPQAKKVKSSHAKGEATFLTEQPVDPAAIHNAIDPTGYTVKDISSEEYTKKRFSLFG